MIRKCLKGIKAITVKWLDKLKKKIIQKKNLNYKVGLWLIISQSHLSRRELVNNLRN